MQNKISQITLEDFAKLLGTTVDDIPNDCKELIANFDSRYQEFSQAEHNQIVLGILKKIDSSNLSLAGKEGKERWEKGWSENLQNFIKNDYDVNELVPKYIKPNQPVRLYHDYTMPFDPNFEIHWYNIFRRWLFKKYLKDVEAIYEFGCGPAFNLVELAKLYPEKKLYGLEWVKSSLDIIKLLAEKFDYNMKGRLFDMFTPDESLDIPENSAILAMGALEQLGTNFEPFLQFILKRSPKIFVHVDSISELYDENILADHLAIKFDKKRKYLEGYLSRLQQLENEGKIEILKTQRVACGSLYHDGYSFIIWKSKKH